MHLNSRYNLQDISINLIIKTILKTVYFPVKFKQFYPPHAFKFSHAQIFHNFAQSWKARPMVRFQISHANRTVPGHINPIPYSDPARLSQLHSHKHTYSHTHKHKIQNKGARMLEFPFSALPSHTPPLPPFLFNG